MMDTKPNIDKRTAHVGRNKCRPAPDAALSCSSHKRIQNADVHYVCTYFYYLRIKSEIVYLWYITIII